MSAHRLATARATRVRATTAGTPLAVDGQRIAHVRESWLVEDRWWTDQPLARRYWELVSESGRNLVVYHDLVNGGWLRQR
ncbi:MAG: hypothetical protein ABSC56_10840 [Solirubrobacteraceae bacterium]|jgi:hypothetical protein